MNLFKKFLMPLSISLFFLLIKCGNVNASVVLGGTTMTSSNFKTLDPGNVNLTFNTDVVYNDITTYPQYFLITMCSDNDNITNWYINNNTLTNVNVYNTSYKCMFPNSSYTGGHIVYIYGSYNPTTNCNVSLSNCLHRGNFTFYLPNQSSWALLNFQNSLQEISIDYASNTLVSQNQDIINQNKEIIKQNENTFNMIYEENNQTQEKLDIILDSSSPDLGGLSNSNTWLPQGPVDSIIMLPLNFINTIIDKLSGTCSPVNLPIPFMQNKYIVLPCLNTIFENIEGFSTLFNLVGVIGSVYLLYNYFVRFYKWVDDTLSFRENTWQDWGGD